MDGRVCITKSTRAIFHPLSLFDGVPPAQLSPVHSSATATVTVPQSPRFINSFPESFSLFFVSVNRNAIRLSLSSDTATGVGDLDTEGLGLGDDVDALAGRDSGGDPRAEHISPPIGMVKFTGLGLWDVLSSVGAVVHEEELDVLNVVNEESLVAGGHHVLSLLVATVTDLFRYQLVSLFIFLMFRYGSNSKADCGGGRTEGMGMFDLKRLRTRLSIPLGLRHDSGTHLKRSDWWRVKRLVPI